MSESRPVFLITIDTEGDNIWSRPQQIGTANVDFLPRFQDLCEKYDFKPTYLTNYEMALDKKFVSFATRAISRGAAEIGMHLHAWNSPPISPLTQNDFLCQPYLVEYPDSVMNDKIRFMTNLLEDQFSTKMISHRAGRWSFDNRYAQLLIEHGYEVDCSVTPGVSWRAAKGNPGSSGGTDYRQFPDMEYFIDPNDVSKQGSSCLLEIPVTIMSSVGPYFAEFLQRIKYVRRLVRRKWPEPAWLRPNGANLESMILIIDKALRQNRPYVEFMLHSSELMPGGSPNFVDNVAIEKLYCDLESFFSVVAKNFQGMTLKQYRQRYRPQP